MTSSAIWSTARRSRGNRAPIVKTGKNCRTSEEEQQQPSSSVLVEAWDILDGMDLPVSIVEKRKQKNDGVKEVQPEEKAPDAEDCHDFYGEVKWCDEILEKVSSFFIYFRIFAIVRNYVSVFSHSRKNLIAAYFKNQIFLYFLWYF